MKYLKPVPVHFQVNGFKTQSYQRAKRIHDTRKLNVITVKVLRYQSEV